MSKILSANLFTCKGTYMTDWVGRTELCHAYEWIVSHMWMSHVTQMNESSHTYERVKSHIWMSHVTQTNESCHTYEWVHIKSHNFFLCVCTATLTATHTATQASLDEITKFKQEEQAQQHKQRAHTQAQHDKMDAQHKKIRLQYFSQSRLFSHFTCHFA